MTGRAGRAPLAGALLAAPLWAAAMAAPVLEVVATDGTVLASLPLGAERGFCLHWNHSVTGGPVADCFRAEAAGLVLESSYQHDFAAGLGHLPGRGVQQAAEGGGYRIEGIDAPVPGGTLALRVGGAAVGHRIEAAGRTLDLTALAAGQRVTLRAAGLP